MFQNSLKNCDDLDANEKKFDVNCKMKSKYALSPNSCVSKEVDEGIAKKIVQQIEYLFSDTNLLKDKFLLKHINRNKEGYVSLKLIASLRKVKCLTKDWRVVLHSLGNSKKLQINEEKTKIRRVEPYRKLESFDASRTVLVYYPNDMRLKIQDLTNMFCKMGTIISISTLNTDEDLDSQLKEMVELYRVSSCHTFVMIKFEHPEEATSAILQSTRLPNNIKIIPAIRETEEEREIGVCELNSYHDSKDSDKLSKIFEKLKTADYYPKVVRQKENSESTLSHDHVNQNCVVNLGNDSNLLASMHRGDSSVNNEWPQRKQLICITQDSKVVVLRQPKGPDGTTGFHEGRMKAGLKNIFPALYVEFSKDV